MTGLAHLIIGMLIGLVGAEIMWVLVFRARVNKANKDLADALDQFQATLAKVSKRSEPK